ncbi:hypothetical protein [Vibrio jasicida]|uniref:hypothetical protein n=1 Tax=Vibrio jasicida TaxID=766224 RepID=UPI00164022B9|nr:hypothetical protein [Vibrio jasicida]
MQRIVVFIFVVITIFMSFLFIFDLNGQEPPSEEVNVSEPKYKIYLSETALSKGQLIKPKHYSMKEVLESELKGVNNISEYDFNLVEGVKIKDNIESGVYIKRSFLAFPDDVDYLSLSLEKDEIPYVFELTTERSLYTDSLKIGGFVSFFSTTSSFIQNSNNINSQTNNEEIVSRIIISHAKVLKIINPVEVGTDKNTAPKAIVLALSVKEIAKLEMAKKIGSVFLIPSAIERKYLTIRSSDMIDNQFGIRELRGGN